MEAGNLYEEILISFGILGDSWCVNFVFHDVRWYAWDQFGQGSGMDGQMDSFSMVMGD